MFQKLVTFLKHFWNVTQMVCFLRYLQRVLTRLIHDSVCIHCRCFVHIRRTPWNLYMNSFELSHQKPGLIGLTFCPYIYSLNQFYCNSSKYKVSMYNYQWLSKQWLAYRLFCEVIRWKFMKVLPPALDFSEWRNTNETIREKTLCPLKKSPHTDVEIARKS